VKGGLDAEGLLRSGPLITALAIAHAHKRRLALEVFLADRHVPIDTKHLERTLRLMHSPTGHHVRGAGVLAARTA
jgi:hypothetical protein